MYRPIYTVAYVRYLIFTVQYKKCIYHSCVKHASFSRAGCMRQELHGPVGRGADGVERVVKLVGQCLTALSAQLPCPPRKVIL